MDATVKSSGRTLVLGLGNAMLSDLGAGIELIHRLRRRRPRPVDIDLIRVGLVNVSLAQVVGEYAKLIVVEARPVGGEAGTVVEMQGPARCRGSPTRAARTAAGAAGLGTCRPRAVAPRRRGAGGTGRAGAGACRVVEHAVTPDARCGAG